MDPKFATVAKLAAEHRVGSVGIVGPHALRTAQPGDRLQLLVSKCLAKCGRFAAALAEQLDEPVELHDAARLPWASHLHLSVCWLNVDTLPRVEYPRGAVALMKHGAGFVNVPLAGIPHLVPVDRPPPVKPGRASKVYEAPPGGFLI